MPYHVARPETRDISPSETTYFGIDVPVAVCTRGRDHRAEQPRHNRRKFVDGIGISPTIRLDRGSEQLLRSEDKCNDRFFNNGKKVGTIDSMYNVIDGEP